MSQICHRLAKTTFEGIGSATSDKAAIKLNLAKGQISHARQRRMRGAKIVD